MFKFFAAIRNARAARVRAARRAENIRRAYTYGEGMEFIRAAYGATEAEIAEVIRSAR